MRVFESAVSERQVRGSKAISLLMAGGIALSGCASSQEHKRVVPTNACRQLGRVISEPLKRQIIDHTAPESFTAPLKAKDLRIVSFGLPERLTPSEQTEDHKVMDAIHGYVDQHHIIHVIVAKTAEIPSGDLGIAIFSGNCPDPTATPSAQTI